MFPTVANRSAIDPGSATSVGTASRVSGRSPASTVVFSASALRPATTTLKPALASATADALPIPLPPPVTTATFPF